VFPSKVYLIVYNPKISVTLVVMLITETSGKPKEKLAETVVNPP
jgi:hypothetical protein